MGDVIECDGSFAAKEIEGGVARRGEKERLGMSDGARSARSQQPGIGVLDDVVLIGQGRETPVQVRAQRRFIRLHFLGEPSGVVDGWGVMRGGQAHRGGGKATTE
jgi:hypothetical protein